MAKQLPEITPEIESTLLAALDASPVPLPAAALARTLTGDRKRPAALIEKHLHGLTSQGRVMVWLVAGKCGFGKRPLADYVSTALVEFASKGPQESEKAIQFALKQFSQLDRQSAEVILTTLVREQRLFEYPAKKGKARVAAQPVGASVADSDLQRVKLLLANAAQPLTAANIFKADSAAKYRLEDLEARLDQESLASRLTRFTAGRGQPGYGDRAAEMYFPALAKTLIDRTPLTAKKLLAAGRKAFASLTQQAVQDSLTALVSQGEIYEQPPLKGKEPTYSVHPADPVPYLKPLARDLRGLIDRLQSAGVSRPAVIRTLLDLAGEADTLPASVRATAGAADFSSIVNRIVRAIPRVRLNVSNGALILLRDLRQVDDLREVSKTDFDRAILEYAATPGVTLHRHDHAQLRPAEEREQFVTDGAGQYFVGLSIS